MLPDHTGMGAVPLCRANVAAERKRCTPATSGIPQKDVADRLDALARAAIAEPIPLVVRLDARDFRGMEVERDAINPAEKAR